MSRQPTALQRQCWEALNTYRSVRAAADALGMYPFAVRDAATRYQQHAGIPGPLPFTKLYRSRIAGQELADARSRIAQLEAERASLVKQLDAARETIADLQQQAHPWVAVHAKLDRLLARPTAIPDVTHRRIADGGIGGRQERRRVA